MVYGEDIQWGVWGHEVAWVHGVDEDEVALMVAWEHREALHEGDGVVLMVVWEHREALHEEEEVVLMVVWEQREALHEGDEVGV